MTPLDEINNSKEFKKFLHDSILTMIQELIEQETVLVQAYHDNRTMPFDFYNLNLREIQARIQCKREVYQRLTGEELE